MTDRVDAKTRSKVMASVRSSGNDSTERRLRSALVKAKIKGWRTQAKDLPGSPDFVFDGKQLAVFVDGCFWHGCPRCYRRPGSSRNYWDEKVRRNMARDRRVAARLRRSGWSIIRVWEHSLSEPEKVIARIKSKLTDKRKRKSHGSHPL
jgi:DNA mismatch endonuclease (patch repair protein)